MSIFSYRFFLTTEEFEKWQINNPEIVATIAQVMPVLRRGVESTDGLDGAFALFVMFKKEVIKE